jgi:CelD/BcsL family acetyltransferase involved in cellulose biosynthesis
MTVDVTYATADDRDRWNDLLAQSPHGTPFHLLEFCRVTADHTDTTFWPLVGSKGQERVGLFPVYERSYGPVTAVFSPPPNRKINYHGPAMVNFEKLKRRKADKRHRRFVRACLDRIETDLGPRYVHVRTGSRYLDTRAFRRQGFETTAGHTYVVDLTPDIETIRERFSADARRNVRGEYDRVDIALGGEPSVRAIINQVAARHAEQDEPFPVTPAYAADLYRECPEGTVRPYVCRIDGRFVGGILALALGDTVYRWLGGAKHDRSVPVNDLLDYHIIRTAKREGFDRYDLVGAYEPGIAAYKAKFAPEMELYQQLERGEFGMSLAASVYQRVKK